MTAIREDDDDVRTGEQPRVRAPHQRRTREQWIRILDAGVELIAEGNGTPFTIAALCERAAVAPRAVYARVDTREDLFMAAYDHGMATIADDETRLFAELTDPSAPEAIRMAVTAVSAVFERHRRFSARSFSSRAQIQRSPDEGQRIAAGSSSTSWQHCPPKFPRTVVVSSSA